MIEFTEELLRSLIVSRALDGKQFILPFDHLIIGIGFDDNLKRYPGLAENAFRLRDYNDALKLRYHIPMMLELANIETDPIERRRLLTFVVAGGNYAGIEVATEICDFGRLLIKTDFLNLSCDEFHVIVVEGGNKILPELNSRYPKLADYALKTMESMGIEIKCNTFIKSATPETALTSSGESIATRTIISCTGGSSNPLVNSWGFTTDKMGRIITDKNLQVVDKTTVWAGGDCAAVPHPKGGYCPPLALYAMFAGKTIGKNIVRQLKKQPLKPFHFTGLGDACSLSANRGICQLKGVQTRGLLAWIIWRIFMILYLPAWNRKFRLLNDWFITAFAGPDIISLQSEQELSILQKFYEAKQTIIKKGDIGASMYLLKSGEVEVIDEENNQVIATLKEGAHFGEIAVFNQCRRTATVIAKTPVIVLEIKRNTAEALSINFSDLKNIPTESGTTRH